MVESAGTTRAGTPSDSLIRETLAGKRILLTGVTGFLGAAVLERLLFDFPTTHVVLLVRGRYGTTPRARVEELLAGNVFQRFRDREGPDAVERALDERLTIVEGDLTTGLDLPGGVDVVVHCAASVSFDPPIDQAFQSNVTGALALYEAVRDSGSQPHLVHVSTAYVAGMTKGVVPEATLEHRVDWRTETEAAFSARRATEEASRKPELLDHFVARARHEHGRAGPQEVARSAEERRQLWVDKRLTNYGRARAQSLGWPDVYTFSKALGERAVEDLAARESLPLSIVRPSIVESALEQPYPGWIEGFKMAEPIILAYGRGSIPEFPGIPEGILDMIPVDLVVNAVLAVAATTPDPGTPAYYHVSSGSRNPLSYQDLYRNVRDYFRRHPLPERGRGEIKVPEWKFPGKRRVEARLRAGERLLDVAERVVTKLPRSNRVRDTVHRLDRERGRLEFVRRYADLYGAYVEIEVIYTDHRTLALYRSLPEGDRRDFGFDANAIDWRHYLQEVHCPTITMAMRWVTPERPKPTVNVVPRQDGVVAVFDMEGTVLDSNVVESYLWLRMAELPREQWPSVIGSVLRELPTHLSADRRDRGEFLRGFYRTYEGASVEGVRRLVDDQVGELVLRRLSPGAVRRIREHRAAGHRTVLITGALDCFVRPLEPLFDEIVATNLATNDGHYTGYLVTPPLVGEARAAWLRAYGTAHGMDLKRSYAYADSHSDLPLLRAVGSPVAVNPDVSLYRVARKRRWPVEDWRRIGGTPRVLIPEAVP
jgi:alcohol-forming fatty acyl-CoA reductase